MQVWRGYWSGDEVQASIVPTGVLVTEDLIGDHMQWRCPAAQI